MKVFFNIFIIIALFKQQNAQHTTSHATARKPASSNEMVINTDRFASTIEHKLSHLIKTEMSAIRQEIQRNDQRKTMDKVINNFEILRNSIDSIKDECQQNIVSPSNESNGKIDTVELAVVALRQSAHRVEKELAIIKKSMRAPMNTRNHFNHPVVYSGNNLFYDHACISDMHTDSGIRKISRDFFAYCEMTQDDGNWIVISNRFDGSINFFRNWLDYKEGFGNIAGEYWMGLEKIYQLTSARLYELMIVMEDFKGLKKSAKYSVFGISSEALGYALNMLGSFSGDAGDCLSYHAGMKFSTFDVDNDEWTEGSCSKTHFGGFWYNQCDMTNPNGLYFKDGQLPDKSTNELQGMHWKYDTEQVTILKSVKMMIRPVE